LRGRCGGLSGWGPEKFVVGEECYPEVFRGLSGYETAL
jgi:hypothetical protein